ncbi:hypothetical protein [Microseira sp. BLCC-F43]|jgi:hypothetical protein|uniref:hypothetical protein n=1 Tax=Microseira sp. BLCC-F43 TaxID=3153602 RepID=UPI0035BB9CEC
MTSGESNESNAVEVDGIEFKTVMPERIVQIPPNRPAAKTQVQFRIRITNNTANPRRFLLFSLLPDLLEINRKKIPRSGPNANVTNTPESSDFKLLMPGESELFLLQGYFYWFENKLNFEFMRKDGTYWWFSNFKTGAYWVQLTYENPYPVWEQTGFAGETVYFKPMWKKPTSTPSASDPIKMEDIWIGEVSTLPIDFYLTQP